MAVASTAPATAPEASEIPGGIAFFGVLWVCCLGGGTEECKGAPEPPGTAAIEEAIDGKSSQVRKESYGEGSSEKKKRPKYNND